MDKLGCDWMQGEFLMIEGEIYQSFRVMVLGVMSGYGKYGQDSYLYICIYVSYVTLCEYGVRST